MVVVIFDIVVLDIGILFNVLVHSNVIVINIGVIIGINVGVVVNVSVVVVTVGVVAVFIKKEEKKLKNWRRCQISS